MTQISNPRNPTTCIAGSFGRVFSLSPKKYPTCMRVSDIGQGGGKARISIARVRLLWSPKQRVSFYRFHQTPAERVPRIRNSIAHQKQARAPYIPSFLFFRLFLYVYLGFCRLTGRRPSLLVLTICRHRMGIFFLYLYLRR